MRDSTKDKVQGKFHEVKGKVKEATGKAMDNPRVAIEGQNEKISGKIQKKVGDVKKSSWKIIPLQKVTGLKIHKRPLRKEAAFCVSQ